MTFRAGAQGSLSIWLLKSPGAARALVLRAAVCLFFLFLTFPAFALQEGAAGEALPRNDDGPAVQEEVLVAADGRYGAPLKFDAPPVDLPAETEQPNFPRAKRPGEAPEPVLTEDAAESPGRAGAAGEEPAEPLARKGGATTPQAAEKPDEGKKKGPIRLFGTVEFRGPLKNLPKWERVLKAEQKVPTFGTNEDKTMPAKVAQNWRALREKLKDKPLMEQAAGVNSFFNQWPYKTDAAVYGINDYWATPAEFIKKSGDCEDYAIAKYYALRNLGVPMDKLRIVALKDTMRNIGHAVLVVFTDDNAYVLDNLTSLILVHSRLKHYAPQYSVNEEYRWAHVVPIKK